MNIGKPARRLIAGGLVAFSFQSPAVAQPPATDWPVEKPYIRFYDDSPWVRARSGAAQLETTVSEFSVSTRFETGSALKSTFDKAGIAPVPPSPSLAAALAVEEAAFAQRYISYFERWGLSAPEYDEYIEAGGEKRFVFYAHPALANDTAAEFDGGVCKPPVGTTFAGVAVSPSFLARLDDPAAAMELRETIAHELLHGSQSGQNICGQAEWIQEGGPEGYAYHAAWHSDFSEDLLKKVAASRVGPYMLRSYDLPLDLNLYEIKAFAAANKQALADAFENAKYEAYGTGSYFRYLLEAQPSKSLAHKLFYSSGERAQYYDLVESELGFTAPRHLATFFTEFASYGAGRFRYFPGTGGVVVDARQNEALVRNYWLQRSFDCSDQPDIKLDGTKAGASGATTIANMAALAGRCVRIAWSGVKPSVPVTIQLLVETEVQAKSLWLGQAYLDGASHNAPPHKYCFQNVTGGGGAYGEPVETARINAAAVDSCLFRKSDVRDVTHEGKTYKAVTFETKFKIGEKPGEAVFIITNAAEKADENAMFDAIVTAEFTRVKTAWRNGRADELGGDGDIWSITWNPADVYFGAATKSSRDIRIDGFDGREMAANLAKAKNKGAMMIVSGDEYMVQMMDGPEGMSAMMMSLDGMRFAVAGSDVDGGIAEECGLAATFTVNERSVEGVDVTLDADLLDLRQLMGAAMGGREPDCEAVRNAVFDRVTVAAYIPDGEMIMHERQIARTFPPGYDDEVEDSLTPLGIADLGGLPRRADMATFLNGMPGMAPPGAGMPGAGPAGAGPGGPGAKPGASPGGAGEVGQVCTAPDFAGKKAALAALANPCECTCAAQTALRRDMEAAISDSIGLASKPGACSEAIQTELSDAMERAQTCMMQTCSAILGKC